MIRVSKCAVSRDGRHIIKDVSLRVAPGERVAVIGENGAGKSTLLSAMMASLRYEGSIQIGDRQVRELSPQARAETIAYMPQRSSLMAGLRVEDVLETPHALGLRTATRARVEDAIETAAVRALLTRRYTLLSEGEKRRVMFARALAVGAPYILLDEPCAYLDPGQRQRLLMAISAAADAGVGMLWVTHDLDAARTHADRCVLLHEGVSIAEGPPDAVLTDTNLKLLFGLESYEADHA